METLGAHLIDISFFIMENFRFVLMGGFCQKEVNLKSI